jgi:dynein heavy chain 2
VWQPHDRFRLWLTTEAHDHFPTILLQQSVKITYEAPPGLKKNLERTYEAWSPEFLSSGSVVRAQLLFMLAWFHAVVQVCRRVAAPSRAVAAVAWRRVVAPSCGGVREAL